MDFRSLLKHPIIQAPMAGGSCTPQLVAAVSNAGALGSLAAALLSPDTIQAQVGEIRTLTQQPFMVNLFVQPMPQPTSEEIERGIRLLEPVRQRMGIDALPTPQKWCEDFTAQLAMVIDLKPAAASFTFDILTSEQVGQLHREGILVVGTATTVDEAVAWETVGADAVVASGTDAGGHRGTFLVPQEAATMDSEELLTSVLKAVSIPVLAAGGIMDGRDIRRVLDAGAVAAQMGTAFLATREADIDPLYKQRLLTAQGNPTRLTRAFSGRYARGIENDFMRLMAPVERDVPRYPIQNALTASIRSAAAAAADPEMMSMWAGTGVARARDMPAAELVRTLITECEAYSTELL